VLLLHLVYCVYIWCIGAGGRSRVLLLHLVLYLCIEAGGRSRVLTWSCWRLLIFLWEPPDIRGQLPLAPAGYDMYTWITKLLAATLEGQQFGWTPGE